LKWAVMSALLSEPSGFSSRFLRMSIRFEELWVSAAILNSTLQM
jgi:hypothetical protein